MTTAGHPSLGRQGFGAMRLREHAAGGPDRDPVAVVDAVLDAGVTMIDTADMYGNEDLVGRAIARRRDEVLLAGKFGVVWDDSLPGGYGIRADSEYVRRACEASLRRLGTDHIELYYLHHRSTTTPIEETVQAMARLVEQGAIGAIGLSNVTAEDLRRAHAVHPVAALQEQWSLAERGIERDLVPVAAELGVPLVAHSPTAHGVLHAAQESGSGGHVALREIASAHGVTVGQVAIAWVHSRAATHGVDVVPLPGSTSADHVRANVAAGDIRLGPAELDRLTAVWAPGD
ncbi:aldo/keto reductase [Pseudonocardia sp. HH130630-07]|uniref:aldo/keto reductase n=1 Tax=Pseudonocardia sp. HH130630-07 TaxID=1690815 RepID=UPI00081526A4|nr:aldo/keto reductase [Pseudonocardia sp. HH130630-07]ANY07237.1 hypothetical protein AFB00_14165 [Pseudonocardia sp. HH130630-07]